MKVIIRKGALGDVIWVEPLIRHFLGLGEKVIFVTDFPILFEHYLHTNLNVVRKLDLKWDMLRRFEKRMDLGHFINLNGYYEKYPKAHILDSYYKAAKISTPARVYPKLYLSREEQKRKIEEKYVVLHLESQRNLNYRQVYGVEWQEIAKHIQERGFRVVEIAKDQENAKTPFWYPTDSLREMMALIYNSSYFIGIDSGPSHLAASFGIPSILFFGSVNPNYRHFLELFKGIILQGKCEFAGCYHETIGVSGTVCRIVGDQGIPPCAQSSTEDVIEAFSTLLGEYHY